MALHKLELMLNDAVAVRRTEVSIQWIVATLIFRTWSLT